MGLTIPKLALRGMIVGILGLVCFLLGVSNVFQNSGVQGLLLLAGLVMAPVGLIVTVYARMFRN